MAKLDVKKVIRHTAITRFVQSGVDLPMLKRISAHKNLSMVERYNHQNGAHMQTAMGKLSDQYKSKFLDSFFDAFHRNYTSE